MNIDSLPFVPARDFKKVPGVRAPRVVVIHDMEAPETHLTAENVAKYFQHPDKPSSCHINVDDDSAVRSVHDNDVAYAAPGCNADGLQMELAGYGKQTRAEWLDEYGKRLLAIASDLVAQWCVKYSIPAKHLTDYELTNGQRGIVGHYQVSAVYKKSMHTDPGQGFPWDAFVLSVGTRITTLKAAK